MRQHVRGPLSGIGLAMTCLLPTAHAQPSGVTGYEAVSIGTVSGSDSSTAYALDEFARVVGDAAEVGSLAVVWINGELIALPSPPSAQAWSVSGISPTTGVLVGSARIGDFIYGTAWVIGTGIFVLDNLPGSSTSCSAATANDLGFLVGSCSFPNRSSLWHRLNPPIDLGTLGGRGLEYALDINEAGEAVGTSENSFGVPRPYLWRDAQMVDIGGEPFNVTAYGWGINNFGEAVGYAVTRRTAFYWADGQVVDLPDPYSCGDAISRARDINDDGLIVGEAAGDSCAAFVATVWERQRGFDPHVLTDYMSRQSDINLRDGFDINNAGQVAAFGDYDDGRERGFLVTPYLFEMSDPSPGRAGQVNTITVTGLQPGQRILLAWGLKEGAQKIKPDCPGGTLLIRDPHALPPVLADANGVATITMQVPLAARGRPIRLQAIAPAQCEISHTVTWVFE